MEKTKVLRYACLAVFLAVFFCVPAYAAYEEEHWLSGGDSFKLKGHKIEVEWSAGFSEALVYVDGSLLVLGEAKCGRKGAIEVCYQEYRMMRDGKVVPSNVNGVIGDDLEKEMLISISADSAVLELTRTADKLSPYVGDEIKVTMRIENTGELKADDVVFEDRFSSTRFKARVVSGGCQVNESYVVWTGSIAKGGSIQCVYVVVPNKAETYSIKGVLEYDDGITEVSESKPLSLKVLANPLDMELKLNETKPLIGEIVRLNVTLDNTRPAPAIIEVKSFKILVPTGFRVVSQSDELDLLTWEGDIGEDPVRFYVDLEARMTGEKEISAIADFLVGELQLSRSDDASMKVVSDFSLEIVDAGFTESLGVGEQGPFRYDIFNNHDSFVPESIVVSVESDLPGYSFDQRKVESLPKKNRMMVIDTVYNATVAGKYYFNITVSYRSLFGEVFVQKVGREVTILESAKPSAQPGTQTSTPVVAEDELADKDASAGDGTGDDAKQETTMTGEKEGAQEDELADGAGQEQNIASSKNPVVAILNWSETKGVDIKNPALIFFVVLSGFAILFIYIRHKHKREVMM